MSSAVKDNKELPKGWKYYKLGEVIQLVNGRAYNRDELLNKGKYKVIRIQNLNGGDNWYYSDLELPKDKYCNKGDLLFAWSTTFGPYKWNDEKAIFHYHIWNTILSDKIESKFAFYYLDEITEELKQSSHGVAMLHITKGMMENWPFPLPPLPEQQRIVKKLDTLFENIDKAIALSNENLTHANNLLPAALNEVFEKKNDKDWKIETWENTVTIKNGKNQKAVEDKNGKYPIYGSGGIMSYANDFICNENTTIIGRKGTINKPIYVQEKFWNVDTAFGIEAGKKIDNKFLYYFCLSYDFTLHNKSTTLPSLAKTDLLKILMPFPELPTQQKIVNHLNAISAQQQQLQQHYKQQLLQLKALKASLLNTAFKGEL